MKQRFIAWIGFVFFLVGCINSIKANHVLGADISYRFVGHDTIELDLTGYRDCNGISYVGVPFNLSTSCGSTASISAKTTGGSDVTPVCKRSCTRCTNSGCSFAFGVQMYFQKAIVALNSYNCCNFTFEWEQCCRTASTSTFGAGSNYSILCTLNKCVNGYHSSPAFTSRPILIVCKDACTTISQAVSSNTGDSIYYKLTEPISSPTTTISYNYPYNYKEPLKYYGAFGNPKWDSTKCQGFAYDSQSGMLNFKAVKEDITEFALTAEQWHKDSSGNYKLIGTAVRSVVLAITSCSNHEPQMTNGFDGKGHHSINAFAGSTLSFDISTSDSDNNDTLSLTWNNSIANASFKVGTGLKPKGTFSWTPGSSDISKKPYIFSVNVNDNDCPIPAQKTQVFYVYVHDSFPNITYSKIDSGCGKYSFQAPSDTSKHLLYQWYINDKLLSKAQKFTYLFKKNGKYPIRLFVGYDTISGKIVYDTLSLTALSEANAGADIYLCPGDKGSLSASGGVKYKWSPSKGLSSDTIYNPTVNPLTGTQYIVKVTSKAGCVAYDTVKVNVSTLYLTATPTNTTVCGKNGTTHKINLNIQYPKNKKTSGFVRLGNSFTNVTIKDTGLFTWTVSQPITLHVYIQQTDSGCTLTKDCNIIFSSPVADAGLDKTICRGDSVQLTATGGKTYQWKAAAGIKNLNVSNPYVKPLSDQRYYLTATDSNGCSATDSVMISVIYPKTYTFSKPAQICPMDTATFSVTGSSAYSYNWATSKTLFVYSSGTILKATPSSSIPYFVKITDKNTGCTTNDSVVVPVDNDCVFPGDANKDKIANYLDLLPIGAAMSNSGSSRSGASLNWIGQPTGDWSKSIGKVNYKHIDCDGNGYIEYKDTLAITKNYGRSHFKNNAVLNERSGNPPFYFLFDKPVYLAGDSVKAALYLGNSGRTLSALGAGVKYTFGSPYIKPGSLKFTFSCDFICSGLGIMNMYRTDNLSSGEGSVVRTDHKASSGYGKVADITYVLLDSTKASYPNKGDTIRLDMMEKEVIDAQGNDITIDGQSAKAAVYRNKASIPATIEAIMPLSGLSIYPNPFNNEFTLSLQLQRQARVRISCFDALGREVSRLMDKEMPAANNTFNFQDREAGMIQPGIYFIKIQVEDEVSVMRLVKM